MNPLCPSGLPALLAQMEVEGQQQQAEQLLAQAQASGSGSRHVLWIALGEVSVNECCLLPSALHAAYL